MATTKTVNRGSQAGRMGRPIEMAAPWGNLARKIGSSEELAAILGVTLRTLHRWATGEIRPHELRIPKIREFFARHGMKSPF